MIYDYLYDWQKQIVDKNKNKNSFGLYLDCGLGKTPLSLALAEANECTKVLVITINSKAIEDNSVGGSWWNWAERSSFPYRIKNKTKLKDTKDTDFLIINYESLFERNSTGKQKVVVRKLIYDFLDGCRDCNFALIIDESHKMKNLQSLQTTAILKIQQYARLICSACYTYLLSGTPFTTGFIDLYTQLKALGCELTKGQFIDNFCVRGNKPGLLGWQQPIVAYKNVNELYNLVHKYALTVKSKEVVSLPEQIFVEHKSNLQNSFNLLTCERLPSVMIAEEAKKRKLDLHIESSTRMMNPFFRNLDYPGFKYFADTPGSLWLRARQISIGFQGSAEGNDWYDRSRLTDLQNFLERNEDNYIIFYNYTPEMLEIYEICEKLGYNIDVYCGEVKSTIFYEKFCKLKPEDKLVTKKNVILANFASGSTGMNWQEYNKCIIFSLPLYKDWEQGLKRIHRLGQKDTTIYHIFYQDNWLDNGMKKALEERVQYTEDMFKDGLKNVN